MSQTMTAYILSVVILATFALFVPCVESLVRLMRRRSVSSEERARVQAKSANDSEEVA